MNKFLFVFFAVREVGNQMRRICFGNIDGLKERLFCDLRNVDITGFIEFVLVKKDISRPNHFSLTGDLNVENVGTIVSYKVADISSRCKLLFT